MDPAPHRPRLAWLCAVLVACASEPGARPPAPSVPRTREPAPAGRLDHEPGVRGSGEPKATLAPPAPVELPGVDALVAEALQQQRMPGCVVVVG